MGCSFWAVRNGAPTPSALGGHRAFLHPTTARTSPRPAPGVRENRRRRSPRPHTCPGPPKRAGKPTAEVTAPAHLGPGRVAPGSGGQRQPGAETQQRIRLDAPDALARQPELRADRLEGLPVAAVQTEAPPQD